MDIALLVIGYAFFCYPSTALEYKLHTDREFVLFIVTSISASRKMPENRRTSIRTFQMKEYMNKWTLWLFVCKEQRGIDRGFPRPDAVMLVFGCKPQVPLEVVLWIVTLPECTWRGCWWDTNLWSYCLCPPGPRSRLRFGTLGLEARTCPLGSLEEEAWRQAVRHREGEGSCCSCQRHP